MASARYPGGGRERGWEEREVAPRWDDPLSVPKQQAEDRRGQKCGPGKFRAFLPSGWHRWAGWWLLLAE